MKTVEVNISKSRKPRQILKIFRSRKLAKGDRLRIRKSDDDFPFPVALVLVLLVIVWYFTNESKKKKSFGDEIEEMLFDKNMTSDVLEKQIEKEYGVKVEVASEDFEDNEWSDLSVKSLAGNYSDDEPDYSDVKMMEPNPDYIAWKKVR